MSRKFGHGRFGPLRRRANAVPIPQSVPLVAYGSGITLSALGADGYYTVTTDATVVNRSIGSLAALSGDLLLEIVPLATPPNTMFGWRENSAPINSSSYADADAREVLQTEGGGGGPNWTGTWKQGVYQANGNASGRNGNLFMERIGSAWNVKTGTGDFTSAASLYTNTAVDTAARYLAITDMGPNASFKIRFRQHP